jgi:hypothetical protein
MDREAMTAAAIVAVTTLYGWRLRLALWIITRLAAGESGPLAA